MELSPSGTAHRAGKRTPVQKEFSCLFYFFYPNSLFPEVARKGFRTCPLDDTMRETSASPRISDNGSGVGSRRSFLAGWGVGMDSLRELLEAIHANDAITGRFRGLLHILVGRRITRVDGTLVSPGATWRDVAALLKRLRWDREMVRQLGIDPSELAPRDRERFWYAAIARASIDSTDAVAEADQLVEPLRQLGYVIGPGPARSSS
jgi:hypothetical protein